MKLRTQARVDQDMVAVLQAEGVLEREKSTTLQIALTTSRRIGAAIGIVMAFDKVTEQAASIGSAPSAKPLTADFAMSPTTLCSPVTSAP